MLWRNLHLLTQTRAGYFPDSVPLDHLLGWALARLRNSQSAQVKLVDIVAVARFKFFHEGGPYRVVLPRGCGSADC